MGVISSIFLLVFGAVLHYALPAMSGNSTIIWGVGVTLLGKLAHKAASSYWAPSWALLISAFGICLTGQGIFGDVFKVPEDAMLFWMFKRLLCLQLNFVLQFVFVLCGLLRMWGPG